MQTSARHLKTDEEQDCLDPFVWIQIATGYWDDTGRTVQWPFKGGWQGSRYPGDSHWSLRDPPGDLSHLPVPQDHPKGGLEVYKRQGLLRSSTNIMESAPGGTMLGSSPLSLRRQLKTLLFRETFHTNPDWIACLLFCYWENIFVPFSLMLFVICILIYY